MEMGYGMAGIEEKVETVVREVANRFDEITYVEIGVAYGATLSAVAATLRESGKKWRAIGIELPNGYSFDGERTKEFAERRALAVEFVSPNGAVVHPRFDQITIYFKDSQSFLTECWQETINLALIDGCHGKPCVILDFLAVEAFVVPQSVVMFHDYGEDQKGHYQPHCPTGLDVFGACQALGLVNGKRKNWKFLDNWSADRAKGGWDMGVFERLKEETNG